jgi:hypothetical protein
MFHGVGGRGKSLVVEMAIDFQHLSPLVTPSFIAFSLSQVCPQVLMLATRVKSVA